MLCRAVLAAVAISCTFSREVIGQGSPRKGQIKDLICVLWLSGMQKEDLDVNMLRKLQRHHVNIDDMRPESLKRQCLDFPSHKKNVSKQVKEERNDNENKTTTEGGKLDKGTKKIKKLLKNDLKIILNNLMESTTIKSIDDKIDKSFLIKKEKTSNYIPITPKTVEPMNKHEDISNGEVSLFSGDLIEKLKYNIYQPNIGNVQQFWQMFTSTTSSYNGESDNDDIRKHSDTSPRPTEEIHDQSTILTNSQKNRSEETDYINKLIADLINNRAKVTIEKSTTSPIDLKKISDQLEKLLKLYPQSSTGIPPSSDITLREYENEKNENGQSNSNDFTKNNIPKKMLSNKRLDQYDSSVHNNKDYNQTIQFIEYRQSNSNHFGKNVIPKKTLSTDEKQYDSSVQNNYYYNDQLSFPQSSKNGASSSYTIPTLALNDKQIMVLPRYQNKEDYKMDKYASRFPELTSQDEIDMMQNYQTVKVNNRVAEYPNKIPVQAAVNKEIELLPKYQSLEEQKIVNFPNGHPNKNDKSMEMLHRYQKTRDRKKVNYFANRIPVHASDDNKNNRYQRLEKNNQKVYFHNRIPVPTLNKKGDTDKIHRYQNVNRNKMTVLDWVPEQASDKVIETLQRNPSELQEGIEVVNFRNERPQQTPDKQSEMLDKYRGENNGGGNPNKGPMQALEQKLDMFDNFQVIGKNNMVENEMMSRYQAMEENNFENFPKKKPASATNDRQRGQHLQLHRYQPEKVNKNIFSSNKILLQAPNSKPWENQSIERTKSTSYLMEVPMLTPDNKQWEMFQKYQSMHEEPTTVPKIEMTKTAKEEIGGPTLSKNCIKEIAENIKAIVLKDLRQNITTTPVTTSSTTTTTMSTPSSPSEDKTTTHEPIKKLTRENLPQNKTQEATHVMEKFIELLEQIKDIKEKKELASTSNVTHQDNSPFNANLQLRPQDIYRVERPQENTPVYSPFAAQIPRATKNNPINNVNFIQMGPIAASGMQLPPQGIPRVQAKPIMIQTNSDEIQPLGVLLNKPFTLIHQNIVVTTTSHASLQRGHTNKRVEKYEQQDEDKHKKNKETLKPRVSALSRQPLKLYKLEASDTSFKEKNTYEPNRYDRLRDFKARIKDNTQPGGKTTYRQMPTAKQREYKNSKFGQTSFKDDEQNLYMGKNDRDYNPKLIYGKPFQSTRYNNHGSKKIWLIKPSYDEVTNEDKKSYDDAHKRYSDITYDLLSRNRNPSRFHERLERVDDRVDYENGKANVVASRQQQPLNMKDPRFDNTHFKNFLKTQQKVNEMLEKILSSKKSPTSVARSFETT